MTEDQIVLLRDKVEVWTRQAERGPPDFRDYNQRAAAALASLLRRANELEGEVRTLRLQRQTDRQTIASLGCLRSDLHPATDGQRSAGLVEAIKRGFESVEPQGTEEPCPNCAGQGISGAGIDAGGCDDCGGTGVLYGCTWEEDRAWEAAASAALAHLSANPAESDASWTDETEHLLSSPENAERLAEAIKQFDAGEVPPPNPVSHEGEA